MKLVRKKKKNLSFQRASSKPRIVRRTSKIPSIWDLREHHCSTPSSPPSPATMAFSEFRPLDEKTLIEYMKSVPALSSRLGDNFDDLSVKEVGDGNLNFVYIVSNSAGSFVIKQVTDTFTIHNPKGLMFQKITGNSQFRFFSSRCFKAQTLGFCNWCRLFRTFVALGNRGL